MDRLILSAGIILTCLGAGFLIASLVENSLNTAFTSGGYLWLIMGAITIALGIKAKRQKQKQLGALR